MPKRYSAQTQFGERREKTRADLHKVVDKLINSHVKNITGHSEPSDEEINKEVEKL